MLRRVFHTCFLSFLPEPGPWQGPKPGFLFTGWERLREAWEGQLSFRVLCSPLLSVDTSEGQNSYHPLVLQHPCVSQITTPVVLLLSRQTLDTVLCVGAPLTDKADASVSQWDS